MDPIELDWSVVGKMARIARVVVPGYPHHVTQRGNRRQKTFFSNSDYLAYIDLLANAKSDSDVEVWAYCLMPNHVHFVVIPGIKTFSPTCFKTRIVDTRE